MFRGNNSNTAAPSFLENHLQYPAADILNQLQLCGNLPVEYSSDPVNYLGSNNGTPFLLPNKCVRDAEAIPSQQKLMFSSNNKTLNDESDRKSNMLNLNPVSTGLRLSYDDEERNSSITSASGNLTEASSVLPSLGNDIKREIDQQKQELYHFIRAQEENMLKGFGEIRQRHMVSFITALEKSMKRILHDKEVELETITRKNKQFMESMKQQAMQGSNEGRGESDADDAASCIDPNNYLSAAGRPSSVKRDMMCKACKGKEYQHLCKN